MPSDEPARRVEQIGNVEDQYRDAADQLKRYAQQDEREAQDARAQAKAYEQIADGLSELDLEENPWAWPLGENVACEHCGRLFNLEHPNLPLVCSTRDANICPHCALVET